MAGQLKAIDTWYNNSYFRSRGEAFWAMFFVNLGIEYVYEMEGYNLNGLYYLPDMFLPAYNAYIEIKPKYLYNKLIKEQATDPAINKIHKLHQTSKKLCSIVYGTPADYVSLTYYKGKQYTRNNSIAYIDLGSVTVVRNAAIKTMKHRFDHKSK